MRAKCHKNSKMSTLTRCRYPSPAYDVFSVKGLWEVVPSETLTWEDGVNGIMCASKVLVLDAIVQRWSNALWNVEVSNIHTDVKTILVSPFEYMGVTYMYPIWNVHVCDLNVCINGVSSRWQKGETVMNGYYE